MQFWRVRGDLRVMDRAPMMGERTMVPRGLRRHILEMLHSAHQGVLSMGLRAKQAIYWPGFWSDIEWIRARCSICNKISPSQANLPPS